MNAAKDATELLAKLRLHFTEEIVTYAERSVLDFDSDENDEGDIAARINK